MVAMLRVTTLYESTAAVTAGYYTAYLTEAEGEIPGVWTGKQSGRFGLSGDVSGEQLELEAFGRSLHGDNSFLSCFVSSRNLFLP